MTNATFTRRLLTAGLALAIAGTTVACSDDDDQVAAESCDAAVAYTAAVGGMPEDPAEMGEYISGEVLPVATTLVDGLPDDVDADAFTATLAEVADTGDPTPLFESADAVAAQQAIGEAVHEGCDFGTIEVEAADYSFDGLAGEIEAGPTSIRFANTGAEEHEMVLFKLADGVEPDAEALLAMPEEEQMQAMTFAGVTFGPPDATSYATLDLEAGDYLAVCFIPTGGPEAGEDAAPHFAHGMHATFTVAG
ncbi:MAG TPA: hypothetical protein VEA78_09650 [Acidimicrobiales bacterium]|nr:hypothetical protein [Acidimicrobiales bacterium]